jgi:hypothetical protein
MGDYGLLSADDRAEKSSSRWLGFMYPMNFRHPICFNLSTRESNRIVFCSSGGKII